MLTLNNMEDYYQVHELENTKNTVNAEFANHPHKRDWFLPVQSGNVMTIYMNIIFKGMRCLPSLIGVPKLMYRSTHKEMLLRNDYSCIRFFTPYRNTAKICNQPLRLFFEDDTEQVEFAPNSLNIVDRNNKNYITSVILSPSIVLLDISKVVIYLGIPGKYNDLIKDFSIMEPLPVQHITNTCLNMNNPHVHMDENSTTANLNKKRKINYDDGTTDITLAYDISEDGDTNNGISYKKQKKGKSKDTKRCVIS